MKWYSVFNPFAYFRKIRQIRLALEDRKYYRLYDEKAALQAQRDIFAELGFDYDKAVERMKSTIAQSPELHHISLENDASMFSEHWIAFAALDSQRLKRILELGTFNGESARFLSLLFPNAEVVTLDLPDDSSVFLDSYGRNNDEYRNKFIDHRTKMLNRPNIRYLATNSFFLPALNLGTFDFIWVDACHEYPDVAWDACNSWHLCSPGGWIFFDDVYLSDFPFFSRGESFAPRDTLKAFEMYGISKVNYFVKRLVPQASANPRRRKYIGVINKV